MAKQVDIPANHPYRSDEALQARYAEKPNYSLRRALLAAGLGVSAVLAFFGVQQVRQVHHADALKGELSQPLPDVAADIRAGKISPDEVIKVTIPGTEYSWTAASDLTRQDHEGDTPVISSIIQAQQGDKVFQGETVILPKSEVDIPTAYPQPPK